MDHFHFKNGALHAENVAIKTIANAVGTPFYCYSSATFTRHVSVLKKAMQPLNPLMCFAVKACPNIAILRLLARLGLGADVVSGGELFRALKAGISPAKIVFSGVGKSRAEMRSALSANIFQFNIESRAELLTLNEEAGKLQKRTSIALRINPDVDAQTHAKISTGKKENKFGISLQEARDIYGDQMSFAHIDFNGISMHIGSQLTQLAPFEAAFSRIRHFVESLMQAGHQVHTLDIGGGLGVPYHDGQTPPCPDAYGKLVARIFKGLEVKLIVEPGRLIAANAGILVSQLLYIKENAGHHYAVIDAGMNDLMRPALYDSEHSIIAVDEATRMDDSLLGDIVGPVCESSDVFAKSAPVGGLKQGDLVAFRTAGAYGASMSNAYNSRLLVPEILVHEDQFHIIRKRPDYDAMLQDEAFAAWQKP
jgi:diaminopimelate decarboxylase